MKKDMFFRAVAVAASVTMISAFSLTGCGSSSEPVSSGSSGSADELEITDDETYDDMMSDAFSVMIERFNSMEVGETFENDRDDGIHVSMVKNQEDLLSVHSDMPEGSLNTANNMFFYQHGDGYQVVQYFFNADTGVETILVLDSSADGSEITPIYVSTTNDTDDAVIQLSDLVRNMAGSIEITTDQKEDGTVSKIQKILNEAGEEEAECLTDIVSDANGTVDSVQVTVMHGEEQFATLDFSEDVDSDTRTIVISDADNADTLSFVDVDGVIDITTAALS